MTANPECGTIDTPILDALHTMHDGKFLHLPVVDRGIFTHKKMQIILLDCDSWFVPATDGNIVTVIDVIHIAHAAVATVSH